MAERTGLLALLLLPCVNAGFAGFSADGPLAGNPEANVRFSANRTAAWVNLTVSGYREPLWRIEPLVMDHMTRIFYVHDLLTPEECDHLLSLAHTEFAPSQVVSQDPDHKGVGELHPIRNSQGMFLNRRMDSVMSRINARLSLLTHLPVDHQEDMQILKYEVDQHYHPHTDWFDPSTPEEMGEENGKQRWITVLHYLNSHGEDYTGGETIFPLSPEGAHQKGWTHINNCTEGRLAVRPKKGDAVMFYAMSTTFDTSMGSTHGSCDVKSGTKYSAPVWMRQTAFHPADLPPDGPVPCVDKDATHCPGWKTSGECTANPGFMRKSCRKSCGVCTEGEERK